MVFYIYKTFNSNKSKWNFIRELNLKEKKLKKRVEILVYQWIVFGDLVNNIIVKKIEVNMWLSNRDYVVNNNFNLKIICKILSAQQHQSWKIWNL